MCKKSVGCPYADDRIKGCKKFILEDELELTTEEWFCQLPTSEKAKVLSNATYSSVMNSEILIAGKEAEQKKWELWLKAKHEQPFCGCPQDGKSPKNRRKK